MNMEQKKIINEWINTSNYVYNKTLEKIKSGSYPDFQTLRNLLVTNDTKKNSEECKYYNNELKRLRNEKRPLEEIEELKQEKKQVLKRIKKTKNENVQDWERKTPKDIRAGAVNKCCNAYIETKDKFKRGEIKHFEMKFKKKKNPNKCICISKSCINVKDNKIIIAPTFLGNEGFEIS